MIPYAENLMQINERCPGVPVPAFWRLVYSSRIIILPLSAIFSESEITLHSCSAGFRMEMKYRFGRGASVSLLNPLFLS